MEHIYLQCLCVHNVCIVGCWLQRYVPSDTKTYMMCIFVDTSHTYDRAWGISQYNGSISSPRSQWLDRIPYNGLFSQQSIHLAILKHHLLHHPDTWRTDPTPIDRQRLFGPNILVETINIIYTVLGYWYLDVQDVVTKFDVWKLLSLVVRFGYLLYHYLSMH